MSIEGNTMTGPAETGGFNYNAWMQLVYGYRSGSGIQYHIRHYDLAAQ